MPLNAEQLGAALAAAASSGDAGDQKERWKEIATAIVSHFQQNALVSVTVQTTGSASAQAGTGTGKIS